jgi:O-antigen/teichoic acid export membrane protein
MMASAVFFVPQSAGFTLQTALAGTRARPGLVGSALRASLLLTVVAGLILLLAGPLLLGFLGSQYAAAWVLLPVLVPALLLSCVTQVYYGLCRAQGRLFESTIVATLVAILVVAPAAAVAQQYGLTGVSVLWAVAQATASLIAARRLITLTRGKSAAAAGEIPSAARHQPT